MNAPISGDIPISGIRTENQTEIITLPLNEDTAMNGVQSLFWESRSGHILVEPMPAHSHEGRDFKVLKVFGKPANPGDMVWLSGWLGESPEDFGIESVFVTLSNGTRAVQTKYESTSWVIHVHGRKASFAETLRNFQQFEELGFRQLAISHETDPKPWGLGNARSWLGAKEWQEVELAVKYALDSGAKEVILFGWSLGALFVGEFLRRSPFAQAVSKVIFDSPLIDFETTLRLQSRLSGMPAAFGDFVYSVLQKSNMLGLFGFRRRHIPTLIRDLSKETLILYSNNDGYVSMSRMDEFAALNHDATIVEIPGARHCRLYNLDKARYQATIAGFIAKPGT